MPRAAASAGLTRAPSRPATFCRRETGPGSIWLCRRAAGWFVIVFAAMAVNSAFAGVSQGIALLTRREATMIAVANFIGLPLLFVSTTLLARAQMPHWMRVAAHFTPVDWGVRAAREVVLPGTSWGTVGLYLLLLVALSAATAGFATWCFRSYQRTL